MARDVAGFSFFYMQRNRISSWAILSTAFLIVDRDLYLIRLGNLPA